MGLPDDWAKKVEDKGWRHLLTIRRVIAKTPPANVLKSGDLLLAINSNIVTSFNEVENIVQQQGNLHKYTLTLPITHY